MRLAFVLRDAVDVIAAVLAQIARIRFELEVHGAVVTHHAALLRAAIVALRARCRESGRAVWMKERAMMGQVAGVKKMLRLSYS